MTQPNTKDLDPRIQKIRDLKGELQNSFDNLMESFVETEDGICLSDMEFCLIEHVAVCQELMQQT